MELDERPRKLAKLDHDESLEIAGGKSLEQRKLINDLLPFPPSSPANGSKDETEDSNPENSVDKLKHSLDTDTVDGAHLSKNQQKKLRKEQEWEAGRDWRRQQRKQKAAEKKERKRNSRAVNGDNGVGSEDQENGGVPLSIDGEQKKKHQQIQGFQVPVGIILDCSYDELMVEKERISLASQITRCYSDVKNAPYRPHLAVSSFNKLLKERFDGPLTGQYHNWKAVRFTSEGFVEMAKDLEIAMTMKGGGVTEGPLSSATSKDEDHGEVGEVVYLSSDSPHTLDVLKPYGTYVVGGLVDKNRYKGLCYRRAIKAGVKTAKLPIGDYLEMNSRSVLTTNHVVEIMVKWLELGDWGQAFMAVMPKRKGGVLKAGEKDSNDRANVKADQVFQDQMDKAGLEGLGTSSNSVEIGDVQSS
jgi:tRNA (guanine9-N1)-methyltransferase